MIQRTRARPVRVRTRVNAEACSKQAIAPQWDLANQVRATAAPPEIANSQVPVIVALEDRTPVPVVEVVEQVTQVQIVVETALETEALPVAETLGVPMLSAGERADQARRVRAPVMHGDHRACAVEADAVEAAADEGEVGSEEGHMRSLGRGTAVRFLSIILFGSMSCAVTLLVQTQALGQTSPTPPAPMTFNTPKEAAEALTVAAQNYDVPTLLKIFGPDGKSFISSSDPVRDKSIAAGFAAKARNKLLVTVDPKNQAEAVLSVGADEWPFPVPIVRKDSKWYFDAKQGRDEILFRRIGSNELDAIQICRGFVDAQKQYASEIHDNSGVNQYAQKIISSPGKHDGLYWKNADGTPGGPISEAIARAIEEGYTPGKNFGYHGYYFKVLKGQGPASKLGQLDYVIEGVMIGGFALLAFPVEYRVTGVKSFMVSYDGTVYQKDMGPQTLNAAAAMERYNPDKTWHRTDDEWPAGALSASN